MTETKDYLALAKRLNFLIRELEVEALDLAAYAKPIAEKKMKPRQIEEIRIRFDKWNTEMFRITKLLNTMLDESYTVS